MNSKRNGITEQELKDYGVLEIMTKAEQFEKDVKKQLERQIKQYDIYQKYLKNIHGIGPIISAGLLAYIGDINRFDNISKLWQMAGFGMNTYCKKCKKFTYEEIEFQNRTGKKTKAKRMKPMDRCNMCKEKLDKLFKQEKKLEKELKTPKKSLRNYRQTKKERLEAEKDYDAGTSPIIQKRQIGYMSNWNDKFKVLCWKIGQSMVKQKASKAGYRRLYDQIKKKEREKNPKRIVVKGKVFFNDGHIHNRALRKVVKIFLANLWMTWREMEGLTVTKPYIITKKDSPHNMIKPFVDKQ